MALLAVAGQLRFRRKVEVPGAQGLRARLDYASRGHARVVVPVIEDLLDRVEALEREVDRLGRSGDGPVA